MCLLCGALYSCDTPEEPAVEDKISFLQNPLIVGSEMDTYNCGLSTSGDWSATTSDRWLSLLRMSGKKGDALTVLVSANDENSDRIGSIKVTVGSLTKTLSVSQEAGKAANFLSTDNLTFASVAEKKSVTIASPSGWDITSTEGDWFKATKDSNISLGVISEVNFSGENRTGKIVITTGDGSQSATINLRQVYSNDLFLASSLYGRKLVYNSGRLFQSVTADKYEELAEGVVSFTMTCTYKDFDENGKMESEARQRKIFLFEVDLEQNNTVAVTLPNDDNANYTGVVQTIRKQANAYQTNHPEVTVWGAVNGDFAVPEQDHAVQGVVYREGECLKDGFMTTVNTVFAIMKDGTAQCLTQTEYANRKGDIMEAVGGRQQLLQNGGSVSFTDTRLEPRTAVGVSKDGKKVWFLIIDGRHDQHNTGSYGASYSSMARIFLALGAHEAINLDGGGSSTYITRGTDGKLGVRNKPSNAGNSERAVVNGLVIVKQN